MSYQKFLMKLSEELKTAHIVDEEEMPEDIIRFNTRATLVFDNGMEKTLKIVIPMDKDAKNNKISVLTPMGSSLIGYSQGDAITSEFPGGKQTIFIKEVKQEKTFDGIDIAI